ncbi:VOC family protein [Paenibacillus chartarius]|uniref:VOC family protein n=1 Tax=Paenibacillus chartarius TaxID=747481 RepID=A0ABV6DUZ7_9BACL
MSPLQLTQLGQVSVPVKDLSRAVAFYRDTLELPLLFQTGNMAFFQLGAVRLLLSFAENAEFDHPSSVLYYSVPDIHTAYELLRSRNVPLLGEPHAIGRLGDRETWMAFFRDSENNVMAIMSEVPVSD